MKRIDRLEHFQLHNLDSGLDLENYLTPLKKLKQN